LQTLKSSLPPDKLVKLAKFEKFVKNIC